MHDFSNSKRGETLISVIVGVVILAIAIGGVVVILVQNRAIEDDYNKSNNVSMLQFSAENIVRKIDTKNIAEKDIFYIYKDPIARSFVALTGSVNERYKFINKDGELIANTGSYQGTVYTRMFTVERGDSGLGKTRQIIKGGIKELIKK